MTVTVLWLIPAAILLAAAALKAADRDGTCVALAAYGVPGRLAAPAWAALVAVEAGLAAGIAAGATTAAHLAGALLAVFLVAQLLALARGEAGAPCGCFGRGGKLSRATAARTALLGCACAALPLTGTGPDLPLALTAAVAAGAVVLAAGRRASAPAAALDVDGEGPALDRPTPLAGWFPDAPDTALAVFTAPGCGLCRRVIPAAEALAARGVTVRRFDAEQDAGAWAAAGVPGAPYAVAVSADGRVLAKGTVNDGRQLESVLAAARRARLVAARRGGRPPARRRSPARRARAARRGARCWRARARSPVRASSARWSRPAAPRPTTSAATSTRPTAARTRRACRGSTAAGCRCAPPTAGRSTTSAG